VLIVVGFHGFPNQVPGGFVGVDIFFVISGFLISGLILDALKEGRFSFIDFYARRARRIFPALIVVLIACAFCGWFVMLQAEYRMLGRHAAAAAAFIANFAFFQDSGYFGPAAEQLPLLHLWSLGIEEQYYLVWPLLIVVAWRFRYGPIAVAAVVFVVSFVSNVMLVHSDATAAFYLPLPRFWELMLGSALAVLAMQRGSSRHHAALREAASWGGLVLLIAAVVLISRDKPFPGWWALLPTIGTALLIFAGPVASINRLVLSRPAIVHIGLISYPLYLWHWPILVFERLIRINTPTDLLRGLGIVVAFVLADLTYRWIEKPIRFGGLLRPKAVAAAAALAATGCLGLIVYLNDGFPQRLPEEVRMLGHELETVNDVFSNDLTLKCFVQPAWTPPFDDKCNGPGFMDRRKVVLWGDSYAAHLYFGLWDLEQKKGDISLGQFTSAGCPPLIAFVTDARPHCQAANQNVLDRITALVPDTVILAANWRLYDGHYQIGEFTGAMLHDTVMHLAAIGVHRIVVVGQFPLWQTEVPRLRISRLRTAIARRTLPGFDPNRAVPDELNSEMAVEAVLRGALAGTPAIFVSPLATYCNDRGCLLSVPGRPDSVSADNGHLTPASSDFFVDANAQALLGE